MIEELHEEMANTQVYPAKKSFPHNYEDILKDFGRSIDTSSPENFLSELKGAGICDQKEKISYSVNEKGENCFMLYAKALRITEGCQWKWYADKATSDRPHDVAELLNGCWLEVQGEFDTKNLTPGTEYEVTFVMKLKDPAYGWEDAVDLTLTLPYMPTQARKCDLRKLPKGRWRYIRDGGFTPSCGQSGLMNFKLRQTVAKSKKGLVIEGVDISPKV